MEIILDNIVTIDNEFWNAIFTIINESYRIEYIIHKGKNYFNCSSSRYDGDKIVNKMIQSNIKPAHKNHICHCRFNCDNNEVIHKNYNRRKVTHDEIKYIYAGKFELDIIEDYKKFLLNNNRQMNTFFIDYFHSGNFNLDDIYNMDDIYLFGNDKYYHEPILTNQFAKTKNLNEESKKIILDLYANNLADVSSIKFISNYDVIITNKTGFNDDYRGLSHTLIELPFLTKINLGKKFTLEDLIISNTNLKSHKFDYWYELYTGSSSKVKNNGSIVIELKFDHGS
jgi:hypothetical protein